jgi:hypothetical protein
VDCVFPDGMGSGSVFLFDYTSFEIMEDSQIASDAEKIQCPFGRHGSK